MSIFKGKTAIVTGGASGIGEAVCLRLGACGANVIVADIRAGKAESVAEQIRQTGGRAESRNLDVTDKDSVYRLVEETAREHGGLDYMFNNAGVHVIGEVRDMSLEQWEKVININAMGPLYGTLAAFSVMTRQGRGHIVNTASLAGITYLPLTVAYNMTKHAVSGLSLSLRAEAAGLGVAVSVVYPGVVKTPLYDTSPCVGANMKELMGRLTLFECTPDKAAEHILKGVAKNKALILFPLHSHVLWLLFRAFPRAMIKLGEAPMWFFRKKIRKV